MPPLGIPAAPRLHSPLTLMVWLPRSELSLRLVMTKFGPPAVRIAYEVGLEPR